MAAAHRLSTCPVAEAHYLARPDLLGRGQLAGIPFHDLVDDRLPSGLLVRLGALRAVFPVTTCAIFDWRPRLIAT